MKTNPFPHVSSDGASVELRSSRKAAVQIVLSKYIYDEDPDSSVWESDVFLDGQCIGGSASMEISSAYDMAQEIIWDHEHPTLW